MAIQGKVTGPAVKLPAKTEGTLHAACGQMIPGKLSDYRNHVITCPAVKR